MEYIEADSTEEDAIFDIAVEHDERRRLIDMSHIYEEIPSVELAFDFENINKIINTLRNHQILKILNCPSMEAALGTISRFIRGFFIRFCSALCLHFVVDDETSELDELQFIRFHESLGGFSKSFLIIFEDVRDNSCLIYWRLKDTIHIFSLLTDANDVRYGDFVKDFLFKSLKNQRNGLFDSLNWPDNQIRVFIDSVQLADQRDFNLLFLAAEAGNYQLAEYLVNICDIKFMVDSKLAVDIAYEKEHYDTILVLLKANSRFPNNFKVPKHFEMPFELKAFIEMSNKIHEAIKKKEEYEVQTILRQNSNLRFFYSVDNHSALATAILSGSFEIYELLLDLRFYVGPHEIFQDLVSKLNESQQAKITKINERKFQSVAEKHILILMSNTHVGPDNDQRHARLSLVCSAFQKLNQIDEVKILLKIVAASRNFQLVFDFNREHVHFLDPQLSGYSTGLFKICGRIYIGALHLTNSYRAHEVLGVIAHEICHFAMHKVFDNSAKPYRIYDHTTQKEFNGLLEYCREHQHLETIVREVYELYGEEQQVAELVVRFPHALGHYIDKPEKVEDFKENYPGLTDFYYDKCLPKMHERLPEIEEESEHQIRKENAKPMNFLKYHWKNIILTVIALIFLSLATAGLVFFTRSCIFKSCGNDTRSFCEFNGEAVCKCYDDWVWSSGHCFECLTNTDCKGDDNVCYLEKCFDRTNVFECLTSGERMFSNIRCDGKKDCKDGSDETYHCIEGTIITKSYIFPPFHIIDDKDYLINQRLNKDVILIQTWGKRYIKFLPANMSKIFPNLQFLEITICSIKQIFKQNFYGLKNLMGLNLNSNQINFFEDGLFDELTKLDTLYLSFNNIISLHPGIFDKLVNLKNLRLDNNQLSQLPPNLFRSHSSLQILYIVRNNISYLLPEHFKTLENLEYFDIESNKLSYLQKDLFKNCKKLQSMIFTKNSITAIELNIFDDLKQLYYINLKQNSCTGKYYGDSSNRTFITPAVREELKNDLLKCKNNL